MMEKKIGNKTEMNLEAKMEIGDLALLVDPNTKISLVRDSGGEIGIQIRQTSESEDDSIRLVGEVFVKKCVFDEISIVMEETRDFFG